LQIVVEELEQIQQKFGDARRTEIVPVEGEISTEDLIQVEEMVITVSHTGYIKRTPLSIYQKQHRGGKGRRGMTTRDEDAVRHVFVASTHDYILVFTSSGKVHWLKVYALPEIGSAGKGKAVVNLIQIEPGERVAAMLAVRDFNEGGYVVLASRRGYIKKTPLAAFSRPRPSGIIGVAIDPGDDLLVAGRSSGEDEILMATAEGQSIRFHESEVRPMGRNARGVIGIRMSDDDALVEMAVLAGEPDILAVTANGYGKRTPIADYRLQGRGGSGIINIRTTARNGRVVASMPVRDADELLIITARGKIIRMPVSGVSRIGRATQGVRLIQTDEGDVVASAIRTAESDDAVPAEETSAAGDDAPPDEAGTDDAAN
jgi:DNA gyrase subunit A